jgi:transcriptional regulator with XRE-family HTH domain
LGTRNKIRKSLNKNDVLRIELDNAELARRLSVTPRYIRHLLRGDRINVPMLKRIREIVVQERRRLSRPAFAEIVARLDSLISVAEEKAAG